MNRLPQISSFILFITLCVCAAYWGTRLFRPPARVVAAAAPAIPPVPSPDAAAGLFGGRLSAVASSNFQLKGVVMASNPDESVAVLAVNGKPPQAKKMHEEVLPGVTVKEINRAYVLLSEGGLDKRINLPAAAKAGRKADSPASTGSSGISSAAPPAPLDAPQQFAR